MKKSLISLLVTAVVGFIIYYFALPALNVHSLGFWAFVVGMLLIFFITLLCLSIDIRGNVVKNEKILGGTIIAVFEIIFGIIILGTLGVLLFLLFMTILSVATKRYFINKKICENTSLHYYLKIYFLIICLSIITIFIMSMLFSIIHIFIIVD